MWFIYVILHTFFMALVNYSDEWLTHSSTIDKAASSHEKVGGVLLISMLLCVVGIVGLSFFIKGTSLTNLGMILTLASSGFMVASWAGYFYLVQTFSAHQIVPLFGLSSFWLLAFELIAGASITWLVLLGIIILMLGAYLLDNGAFKIEIPSKLLFSMLPISFCWAITVFFVRIAAQDNDALNVYLWQLIGIFSLGALCFILVPAYRRGFLGRIKTERMKFIGPSLLNESMSQLSFMFATLAIAAAPMAVYLTALGGLQSIFLMLIMFLFPIHERNTVTKIQWLGVLCVAVGIALLELR